MTWEELLKQNSLDNFNPAQPPENPPVEADDPIYMNPFGAGFLNGAFDTVSNTLRGIAGTAETAQYDMNHANGVGDDVRNTLRGLTNPAYYLIAMLPQEGQNTVQTMATEAADAIPHIQNSYEPTTWYGKLGTDVANGLGQMVPGIATAIATRNPQLAGAVSGVGMYGSIMGDTYKELRDKGVSPDKAYTAAAGNAAAQSALEGIGFEKALDAWKLFGKSGFWGAVGKGALAESGTEAIQEVPDEYSKAWATGESVDPAKLAQNAGYSALVGAIPGALFGGLGYRGSNQNEAFSPSTPDMGDVGTPEQGAAPIDLSDTSALTGGQYLMQNGYSPVAAAGIAGNLMKESGGDGFNLDTGAVSSDGNDSFGIAQWTDSEEGIGRRTDLENFASERGKDPSDFQTQLDFLMHEVDQDPGLKEALNNAKTPEEAARIFHDRFERSADGEEGKSVRAENARKVFDNLGNPNYTGMANGQTANKEDVTSARDYLKQMTETMDLSTEEHQRDQETLLKMLADDKSDQQIVEEARKRGWTPPETKQADTAEEPAAEEAPKGEAVQAPEPYTPQSAHLSFKQGIESAQRKWTGRRENWTGRSGNRTARLQGAGVQQAPVSTQIPEASTSPSIPELPYQPREAHISLRDGASIRQRMWTGRNAVKATSLQGAGVQQIVEPPYTPRESHISLNDSAAARQRMWTGRNGNRTASLQGAGVQQAQFPLSEEETTPDASQPTTLPPQPVNPRLSIHRANGQKWTGRQPGRKITPDYVERMMHNPVLVEAIRRAANGDINAKAILDRVGISEDKRQAVLDRLQEAGEGAPISQKQPQEAARAPEAQPVEQYTPKTAEGQGEATAPTQQAVGNHVEPNMPAPLAAKPSDNLTPEQLAHRARVAAKSPLARDTLRKADAGDEEAKAAVAKWMPGVEDAVRAAVNEEDGNENKENQNGESAGTEDQVEKSAGAEGNEQNETAEEISKEKAPAKAEEKDDTDLPKGYHTESGEPLISADKKDFIVRPNGSKDFGYISPEIEKATNGRMPAAPIRMQVGDDTDFGFKHIVFRHSDQILGKGYNILDYVSHILTNFDKVYDQSTKEKPNRFVLYVSGDNSKGFMPLDLEFKAEGNGKSPDFYTIVSVMPHNAKIKGTLIFDGSVHPSSATTNGALLEENGDKGGATTSPTVHVKTNVPSTSNVSQSDQKSKKYTSKSYKISHNKSFKAITKNGVIVVKDGAKGKGEIHENDNPHDVTVYKRTLINVPIDDITKAVKNDMNPHSAIDKIVRPKVEASIEKLIKSMDPKKKDPYAEDPNSSLKEACQTWWDEEGRASNEFTQVVDANRDAVEDVYGQYLKDHPDILQSMHPSIKREVMNAFHIKEADLDGMNAPAEETKPAEAPKETKPAETSKPGEDFLKDHVIVAGVPDAKQKPVEKPKGNARTFIDNPDALFNPNALKNAPKAVTDIIEKMPKAEKPEKATKQAGTKNSEKPEKSEPYYGFLKGRDRMTAGRITKILSKKIREGNRMVTRAESIENLVAKGYLPFKDETNGKEGYNIEAPVFKLGDTNVYEGAYPITKTEYEYAKYVMDLTKPAIKKPRYQAIDKTRYDGGKEYYAIIPKKERTARYAASDISNIAKAIDPQYLPFSLDEGKGYRFNQSEGRDKFIAIVNEKLDKEQAEFKTRTDDETQGKASNDIMKTKPKAAESEAQDAGTGPEGSRRAVGMEPAGKGGAPETAGTESGENRGRSDRQSPAENGRHAGNDERKDQGNVQNRAGTNRSGSVEPAGSHGNDERRAQKSVKTKESISPKVDKIETDVEKKVVNKASDVPGHDYVAKEVSHRGAKTRARDNITAIKLLKKIESEHRKATPAEQEILAGYSGWGGLSSAMKDPDILEELQQILTKDELARAKASLISAYYTPPVVVKSMWKLAERLGFKGGRVLDPSMGTGRFFGYMPEALHDASTLVGNELDPITARIAKQLYQKASITNKDFADSRMSDNYFDLAITNVPFSTTVITSDRNYANLKLQLHNYFFAKSLDKVRPGGLVMFITTQRTMDNVGEAYTLRQYLDNRAELVGAIRLPKGTFADSQTDVGTDIIILRKLMPGEKPKNNGWLVRDTINMNRESGGQYYIGSGQVNRYFADHGDHAIGTPFTVYDSRYGGQWTSEWRLEDENHNALDLGKELARVEKTFPENIYQERQKKQGVSQAAPLTAAKNGDNVGDVVLNNGTYSKVIIGPTGENVLKPFPKSAQPKVKAFLQVRDDLQSVLEGQVDSTVTDEELAKRRAKLDKSYQAFVSKYGYLNNRKNVLLMAGTTNVGSVLALENYTIDKKTKQETVKKADIFTTRTVGAPQGITHASTPQDALSASLRENGSVDMAYIAKLLNTDEEGAASQLEGLAIEDPIAKKYVPMDEYLSGNVRQKLEMAEIAAQQNPKYRRNVEELKKVVPKWLTGKDIIAPLGASWIPVADIQAFLDDNAGPNQYEVSYDEVSNKYHVDRIGDLPSEAERKYAIESIGRKDVNFGSIVEAALNNKSITFPRSENDSVAIRAKKEAAETAAQDRVKKLNKAFEEWIWKDDDRRIRLEKTYNNTFNSDVLRTYDGSFLTFPGYSQTAGALRRHQKNGVWRILNSRATLLAHEVGSGKTRTMQAAGMELRRLGLARKILYVLPKNTVPQFEREFYNIYPNAKILVITNDMLPAATNMRALEEKHKKGLISEAKYKQEKERATYKQAMRNGTYQKIKTGDWDAILIAGTTFEKLPMSEETYQNYYDEQIKKYTEAMELTDSEEISNEIQKQIEALQNDLKKRIEGAKENLNGDTFETLGIDQMFVDEADEYKNLGFPSTNTNIKDIKKSKSNRAADMNMKVQYLMGNKASHGVVFATGTPVSNTIAELYIMEQYLEKEKLENLGLGTFDKWASTSLRVGNALELDPDGKTVRQVQKVLTVINQPEVVRLFREVADVVRIEDLPDVKRPKAIRKTITVPKSNAYKNYMQKVILPRMAQARGKRIHKKGEDNMLAIIGDMRKAALYMPSVDPHVSLAEACPKIDAMVDQALEEYEASKKVKGTQVIFCDFGIPRASGTEKENEAADADEFKHDASVYEAIKSRLVAAGIPEKEIKFIQEAGNNDDKKQELFDAVNRGDVRFIIGSTGKLGVGVNIQKRAVAVHHLDCPWRPRDIEQREARVWRQGNMNKEVHIYSYAMKGTYDANQWGIQRDKAFTIGQVMTGKMDARAVDDVSEAEANSASVYADALDDPRILEQAQVQKEVRRLQQERAEWERSHTAAAQRLQTLPGVIAHRKQVIANADSDLATLKKNGAMGGKYPFSITIQGKTYDNRNDANEAMKAIVYNGSDDPIGNAEVNSYYYKQKQNGGVISSPYVVGKIAGMELTIQPNGLGGHYALYVVGKGSYMAGTPSAIGAYNVVNKGAGPLSEKAAAQKMIDNAKMQMESDQRQMEDDKSGFPNQADLDAKQKELDDINQALTGTKPQEEGNENAAPTEEAAGETKPETGGSEPQYLVTNNQIDENTQVPVIDVSANKPQRSAYSTTKRVKDNFEGKTFYMEGSDGEFSFSSKSSAKHFNDSNNVKNRHSNVRRRILAEDSSIESILNGAVYVDRHDDVRHPTADKYIDCYAAVRVGGTIHRIRIVARDSDNTPGKYTIEKAELYDFYPKGKVKGTPALAGTATGKTGSVPDTITVAELLDGVKDRDDKYYVVNGKLQYDPNLQFSILGRSSESTVPRTTEELEQQVREEFPNARNFSYGADSMDFDTDGGHVTVNFSDESIVVDRTAASKGYGYDVGKGRTASGVTVKTSRGAVITLAKAGYDRTIAHEAFHFMRQFLTARENGALEKKYKTEEEMAEAYRKWRIARAEGRGTLLGKIMQKIQDLAHAFESLFRENEHNVFRKLETNQVFNNKSQNQSAAHVMYMMNPENTAKDFLKAQKNQISKTMLRHWDKDLAEAKENPRITAEGETSFGDAMRSVGQTLNTGLNNSVKSTSRIKDPLTRVIHSWADTAMMKYRQNFSKWTKMYGRALDGLSDEEKGLLNAILLEEDAKAKEFSQDELAKRKDLPESVVTAHGRIRTLMHQMYNAINAVYTGSKVETKNFKTKKEAESWAKIPFFQEAIVRKTSRGNYRVTYTTPRYSMQQVSEEAAGDIKNDANTFVYTSPSGEMAVFRKAPPLTNKKGYMPHLFHDWFIIATDANGVGRVVGSGVSIDDAYKKAHAMSQQKEYEGYDFKIKPKQYNFENGDIGDPVVVGDKDYDKLVNGLQKTLELSLDQAKEALDARRNGRHMFFGSLLHRKGAEGFESNMMWAIQQHISTSARYVALDPFKSRAINVFERAYGDFNGSYSNAKANFLQGYINSVIGKPGKLEKWVNALLEKTPGFRGMKRPGRQISSTITGLQSVLKLSASPAAAFVNLLQIGNAIGYLGVHSVMAGLRHAVNPTMRDKRVLAQLGTDEEVGLENTVDYQPARLNDSASQKALSWYTRVGNRAMALFTGADRLIRRATVIAAFNKGRLQGMSEKQAMAYAKEINRKVNFDYSVADAPRMFRALEGSIIGDLTLQFQKYGVKEMEVVSDFLPILGKSTTPKQKAEFFGFWLVMGGLFNAVPLQDFLMQLLSWLLPGDDDDPEEKAKRAIMEWAGSDPTKKAMATAAMYGIGGLANIDISQRVGLKGIVPDLGRLYPGGVTTSTVMGIYNAIHNDDIPGVLKAVSPEASNIYQAVAGYGTDSKGKKTVDYDGWDRAMKALGFRTVDEALATDKQAIAGAFKREKASERQKARDAYYDNPSAENRARLKALGYSDNDIKKMKNPKEQSRLDRTLSGLPKNDRKELGDVMNF